MKTCLFLTILSASMMLAAAENSTASKIETSCINNEIIPLSSQNFTEVTSCNALVVIDVYAPWCGPCRMFSPIFEKAHQNFRDKVVFAKYNTTIQDNLAKHLNVHSLPTIIYFKDGKEIGRHIGYMSEQTFFKQIEGYLSK